MAPKTQASFCLTGLFISGTSGGNRTNEWLGLAGSENSKEVGDS